MKNGRNPLPIRSCRKKIGPDESSLISNAANSITGESTRSPAVAAVRSNRRFITMTGDRRPETEDPSSSVFPRTISYGSNHPFDVCFGHFRVDRNRNDPLEGSTRVGELLRAIPKVVAVVRMKV